MSGYAVGFWVLVVATLLRAGMLVPALVGRRPGAAPRLVVAGVVFALYVVNTVLAARRVGDQQARAANQVWGVALVGLVLVSTVLGLL